MRKATRLGDGSIRVPRDMTDEEFDYALNMHTPQERERLAKETTQMLRWAVWSLRHPKLASVLNALVASGYAALASPRRF